MSAADIACAVLLLAVNGLGVLLVAMSLPGTWLIVLATASVAWLRWESGMLGWVPLVAVLGLAVLGEVLELVAGALGARKAGASVRGALGAMAGGIAGGILGTIFIPVLVVGSVLGAALGAFGGAVLGERLAGRGLEESLESGKGAFAGRILGTVSKLAVASAMWIVVALASFL
ncbi:MAG: DUF456 domain-containing protein [Planctomycetes bacterium]|nr:DUF456 domain-containing protein [Planctomycetota bacterium]